MLGVMPQVLAADEAPEYVTRVVTVYGKVVSTETPVDWPKAPAHELHNGDMFVACYQLGLMYQHGKGVEVDEAKAVDLYVQSCAGGLPEAVRTWHGRMQMAWVFLKIMPRQWSIGKGRVNLALMAPARRCCVLNKRVNLLGMTGASPYSL